MAAPTAHGGERERRVSARSGGRWSTQRLREQPWRGNAGEVR
jgi:hypothetical protein